METTIRIAGMTCQNCAKHIREGLEAVPGVTKAEVDLANGLATVFSYGVDMKALEAAVVGQGYEVVSA